MTDLERKIYKAVHEADTHYQQIGATGTKNWIRDFFLPYLEENGLIILERETVHEMSLQPNDIS